jgi:hypothetical protein
LPRSANSALVAVDQHHLDARAARRCSAMPPPIMPAPIMPSLRHLNGAKPCGPVQALLGLGC